MQDAEVKNRLSLAFESTKDVIVTCRRIVTGSSIPSSKKEEILEDLRDITNIMRRRKYEDIEPIDEAINALNEQGSFFAHTVSLLILSARIYAHVRNISGEKELGECLKHLLEWLHYIKKTVNPFTQRLLYWTKPTWYFQDDVSRRICDG